MSKGFVSLSIRGPGSSKLIGSVKVFYNATDNPGSIDTDPSATGSRL